MILPNSPHEDPAENLLKQHEGLIRSLAHSLWRKLPETVKATIDLDDLYQMGRIKFIDLIRHDVNFDPSNPYYIRAIYYGIIGGLRAGIRKIDFLKSDIDAFEAGTERDFFDVYEHKVIKANEEDPDSEDKAVRADIHRRLQRVIEGLTERDQRILNSFLDGMSMPDIALKENLSKEGVSQIIKRVQKKAARVCGVVLQREKKENGRKILPSYINILVFRIHLKSGGQPVDYKKRVREKLIQDGYSSDDKEFLKVDKLVGKAIATLRQNGYNIQTIDVQ